MSKKWKNRGPQIKAKASEGVKDFRISAASSPATIKAAEGNGEDGKPKLGRFQGRAYTGAPMRPEGWGLPIIVDLDGVRISSQHRPVLRQHNHEQIVGHTDSVKVTTGKDGGIDIAGPLSGESQHVDTVRVPASNGFQWQLSIGATPVRTEFVEAGETVKVNGRDFTGPGTISRETELGEISFVPLGADGATTATVTASKRKENPMWEKTALKAAIKSGNIKAGKYSDEEVDAMSDDDAKAALKKCMSAADDDEDKDKEKKADASRQQRIQADNKAYADNALRIDGIRDTATKYNVAEIEIEGADGKKQKVNLVAHAINNNWTDREVDVHARLAALEKLHASRPGPGVGVPGGLAYSTTSPEITGAVLECAVFDALRGQFRLFDDDFYRIGDDGKRRISAHEQKRIQGELNARYPDQIRQAAHTHFKGQIGLKQMLAICAASTGYRGPENFGLGEWGTVANHLATIKADASTVNTPATLANVQNKFMLQGYMFTEQVYAEIAQFIPVKDLKPTKSVQLFGDFQFQSLNVAGEIVHASVGDNAYANQAQLEARMITLKLEYIINDDLGMFGQVPMMLGRGWGLDMNDKFWTKFMAPGFDDGGSTNFYAATHTITGQVENSNLSSGATTTLSSEGLRLANVMFANQVDPAGKPLGIDPELLVYPPELDNAALELMNAQFIIMAGLASTSAATKQPNTNIWKGRYKPLMSRYLNKAAYTGYSTAAWYLLANPSIIPVIQIALLGGQMTPTVQTASQDWQFNTLGISMRGWGGFGVNSQNSRGGVKSAGA